MKGLRGVDVSSHNPLEAVPLEGVDFFAARLSMGANGRDALAEQHLRRARDHGIERRIGYHYLRGDRPGEAQARCLLSAVDALDRAHGGKLVLAVDVEDLLPPAPPWPRDTYRTILLDFLSEMRRLTSRLCVVYGSGAYLAALRLPSAIAEAHPLWLADWTPPITIPTPWAQWTILQTGVVGGLDRDLFAGSRADWDALFAPRGDYAILGAVADAVRRAHGLGAAPDTFITDNATTTRS